MLKDISDKSISSIKENFRKLEDDYQEKIKFLQSAYSSLKKDKENETKKLENSILDKEEIRNKSFKEIKSRKNENDFKEKTNLLESKAKNLKIN